MTNSKQCVSGAVLEGWKIVVALQIQLITERMKGLPSDAAMAMIGSFPLADTEVQNATFIFPAAAGKNCFLP